MVKTRVVRFKKLRKHCYCFPAQAGVNPVTSMFPSAGAVIASLRKQGLTRALIQSRPRLIIASLRKQGLTLPRKTVKSTTAIASLRKQGLTYEQFLSALRDTRLLPCASRG